MNQPPTHTAAPPWRLCRTCSTQTQTESPICPWCGSHYTGPAPTRAALADPPPPPIRSETTQLLRKTIVGVIVALAIVGGILAVVWSTGGLDEQLAGVGLNKNPCLKNLFTGATICGDDAETFCRRFNENRQIDACNDAYP